MTQGRLPRWLHVDYIGALLTGFNGLHFVANTTVGREALTRGFTILHAEKTIFRQFWGLCRFVYDFSLFSFWVILFTPAVPNDTSDTSNPAKCLCPWCGCGEQPAANSQPHTKLSDEIGSICIMPFCVFTPNFVTFWLLFSQSVDVFFLLCLRFSFVRFRIRSFGCLFCGDSIFLNMDFGSCKSVKRVMCEKYFSICFASHIHGDTLRYTYDCSCDAWSLWRRCESVAGTMCVRGWGLSRKSMKSFSTHTHTRHTVLHVSSLGGAVCGETGVCV